MAERTLSDRGVEYDNTKLWFDGLIHKIRTDYFMISEGVAPEELSEMYNAFMEGDEKKINELARNESSQFFIKSIIKVYIAEFKKLTQKPQKLAAHLTDAKILLWAEIKDDDWETEKELYLLEGKVNSLFHQYGYHVDTFIVESSDVLEIPRQYQILYE